MVLNQRLERFLKTESPQPEWVQKIVTFCKRRPSEKIAFPLVITSFCVIEFIRSVDTSILTFLVRAVAEDLHASTVDSYWCSASYLFSMTATQPIFGGIAEVVGRRTCTLSATIIFMVGSIACATAKDISWLIGARALQGLGSGGMDMAFSLIIVDIVSLPRRPMYVALLQLCAGVGLIFGGLIGALVIEKLSWRWVFWINLPLTAVPLLCFIIVLHVEFTPKSFSQQIKAIDWTGTFLIIASLTSLLFAIFGGGVVYPWISKEVLGPLIAGICGLVLFILNERYVADRNYIQPLMPLRIFGNRTAGVGYFIAFIHGMSLTIISSIFPLYFYITDELSFIPTAVRMLPTPLVISCWVIAAGYVLNKTKRFKWSNVLGLVLLAAGFLLLFTLKYHSSLGQEIGYQVIYSAGIGILFPGRIMAVQSAQERDEDVGLAASLISVTLNLGQCFGLALGVALFDNFWNIRVRKILRDGFIPPNDIFYGNAVQENLDTIKSLPVAIKWHYQRVGAETCSYIFLIFAVVSGFTLFLSLFSRNLSFDRETRTRLVTHDSNTMSTSCSGSIEKSSADDAAMAVVACDDGSGNCLRTTV
ncbi:MFS general substrate transporter [Mollisia scopiformis]|uniref:MFS general substrate transporter n=1 Tax=Mollisia scopiformis TaxID=149040 RepID=A0A194XBE3_MOLSC|nr:MFS general substrate transporter [Mollisia scopiformis]KUJ17491.1 MFS general substrate transporter [Mollisia scopiformis]